MVRTTLVVILWQTVCNLSTFFPDLSVLAGNMCLNVLVANHWQGRQAQRHTYGYDLVGSPGEKVCLDIVGPLKPTKKGHTSLLTIIDVYT